MTRFWVFTTKLFVKFFVMECTSICFRIFQDHVAILNLNPLQYLRWTSLWQKIGNGFPFTYSKSAKNTRTVCQIYSKLTIKKPEQWFYCQLWIYFVLYSTVHITEFEQINVCWAWDTVVSDNKLFFSNFDKYVVLWARMDWDNFLGHMFSSLFTQHKVTKG